MIWRTGACAERQDFFLKEINKPVMGQQRWRSLKKIGLVGRAAALGNEEEFIGVLALRIDFDLRREVGLGVFLLEHRERSELRIAQIILFIGIFDAFGERALVHAVSKNKPALLPHDDGRAGILAHRQYAARRNICILQKIKGDEFVV